MKRSWSLESNPEHIVMIIVKSKISSMSPKNKTMQKRTKPKGLNKSTNKTKWCRFYLCLNLLSLISTGELRLFMAYTLEPNISHIIKKLPKTSCVIVAIFVVRHVGALLLRLYFLRFDGYKYFVDDVNRSSSRSKNSKFYQTRIHSLLFLGRSNVGTTGWISVGSQLKPMPHFQHIRKQLTSNVKTRLLNSDLRTLRL